MTMDDSDRRVVAVIAHRGDAAAVALTTLLRRRGRVRATLVWDTTLIRATVAHRPSSGWRDASSDGGDALAGDAVRLPDGTVLDAGTGAVVWRLGTFPTPAFGPAHEDYAAAEGFALGLSWLAGIAPALVNPPDPMNLAGRHPDLVQLAALAREAGVESARFTLTADDAASAGDEQIRDAAPVRSWGENGVPRSLSDTGILAAGPRLARPALRIGALTPLPPALVAGGHTVGAPDGLRDGLVALCRATRLEVAEVALARQGAASVVTGLAPVPTLADAAHLTAFAAYLEDRVAARVEGVAA